MRLIHSLAPLLQRFPAAEGDIDDSGNWTTTNWLIPERAELIYGGLAALIVIGVLVWKAGPIFKKSFADRTARIEQELDESAQAESQAKAEAQRIRTALGDIDTERRRLLAEADAQAEALLTDGRARLEAEIAELEAKAESDLSTAGSRASDELRAEIARLASVAAEQVVTRSLDDGIRHDLVESYIQRVGASSPTEAGARR